MPKKLPKTTVLTIKGSDAWKKWLRRLCDHTRMPTSTVVDLALIDFARKMRFEEEPPKR